MIKWTRNGGGDDDSLDVCKQRCVESTEGCFSFTRDSKDGECILYTTAYTATTGPAGANTWECWHRASAAENTTVNEALLRVE